MMFQTTRWSLILAAREDGADHRAVLDELCRAYRAPVHAFIRRTVKSPLEAEDLTQAFFLAFLEHRFDTVATRERGRFRVFLLSTVKHFLFNAHDYAARVKRGGRAYAASLDDLVTELDDSSESPEQAFERVWALTVLDRAVKHMRQEAIGAGKVKIFDRLQGFLIEMPEPSQYATIASELGMRPNSVAVTVHRLRERLKERVRAELLETVNRSKDLDSELRVLHNSLSGS